MQSVSTWDFPVCGIASPDRVANLYYRGVL